MKAGQNGTGLGVTFSALESVVRAFFCSFNTIEAPSAYYNQR